MKMIAVFLLCCLAAASANSGITSEYGLLEEVETSLGQLAEKIRQRLQDAFDKLREKIRENSFIFDALKDRIAVIQKKILELANIAKEKIIEKAHEIRDHLFALVKSYLERLEHAGDYALYDAEGGSFLERLAERIKTSLENLLATVMEKVEKYSDIASDIKDKVVAIKEKLQEIPKAGAAKLLEIAQKVKEQIKALLKDVIEKVSHKEEVAIGYALYEASEGGLLERISEAIKSQLERFLARIVELVDKYADIADDIKGRVLAIKEKLQEIPKAGFSKLLELAKKIKSQLQALLKETVDKIAEKHEPALSYASYDAEEGTFLERLAERIKSSLENLLATVMDKVEKYTDIASNIKEKILAIKEKLQEIPKAGAAKLLELAQKIKEQIKAILREVIEKSSNKVDAFEDFALYETSEKGFVERISEKIKAQLERFLTRIVELVNKYTDIFDDIKDKVLAIKAKLEEIPKAGLAKLFEIAKSLKSQLQDLLREAVNRIAEKHEDPIGYALYIAEQTTLTRSLLDGIRDQLQNVLDNIKSRLLSRGQIFEVFKATLEHIQELINGLAQEGLGRALAAVQVIKDKLMQLLAKVTKTITGFENLMLYAQGPGESSRRRLQTHLDELKNRVAKFADVQGKYQEKLDDLQRQVDSVSELSGMKLALTSSKVLGEIGKLRAEILAIIGTRNPKSYAESSGESSRRRLQTHLDELKSRVAKFPDVQSKYQEKLDDLQRKVDSVSELSGLKLALTSSRVLGDIGKLRAEILAIIGTKNPKSYSEGLGNSSQRRLQTHLDELKKRVAKYPDVQDRYQAKLDDLQREVDDISDLSGLDLAITSSRVLRDIGTLRAEILNIIGTRPPKHN